MSETERQRVGLLGLVVHRARFATRDEARAAIFWWIEGWYNRRRRHSALGYLSPEQLATQSQLQRAA